jgi:hypothetical protein
MTVLLAALVSQPLLAAAVSADPIVFSFAFVGCNRVDRPERKLSPSTANTAQLLQTFTDVGNLDPLPRYLFLAGDIVLGEQDGTAALGTQIDAWKKLVSNKINPKIKLVVFTGNHELLKSVETPRGSRNFVETPNLPAYGYWQENMKRYINGNDGPASGGADTLLQNEQGLSYTFTAGDVGFIILNTDTAISTDTAGNIPLNWFTGKLDAAQQNDKLKHIFVMGHKPIEHIQRKQAWPLYTLLGKAQAAPSKVRAYLTAHDHTWVFSPNLRMPDGSSGTVPQIIAGNAGSKLPDYFGFTVVSIKRSGAVIAQSYGRPVPRFYADPKDKTAATLRQEVTLYAPKP